MVLWTIAATVMVVVLILLLFSYRRQVKKTCRQLEFRNSRKTNLRLTSSLPFSELNELIDRINNLIDLSQDVERTSQKSKADLKEAITSLAHDIRTPLTSMDGYLQLLSQSQSEDERNHYLAVIQSRITVLEEMLEKLFTYTKLQSEAYTLELEPLDFGKCVRDTVFSFYDEFQNKEIIPEISFCEEPLQIIGNEEALHRTIQNLIKNALEHGNTSISLVLTREKSEVVFCCFNDVQNTDEIDISKVFAKFYKADFARTHSSTGLGLFIAKGLVERMNGRIIASLQGDVFKIEIGFPLLKTDKRQSIT